MKLTALDLHRSRGLGSGYKLDGLSPGFNVIVGANGSGKSSLCRAIAALLWETEDFQGSVEGRWEVGGRKLSVLRESGAAPRWDGDGRPALPDQRFRGCFSFSVDAFLNDTETDEEIQRVIRTELLAGFDLSQVLRGRRSKPGIPSAVKLKGELVQSHRKVEELTTVHRNLLREQQRLGEKNELREASKQAGQRVRLLEDALELADKRAELTEAAARLEDFPPLMKALRGDTEKFWKEREAAVARARADLREGQVNKAKAEGDLKAAGLEQPVSQDQLQLFDRREQILRALEQEARDSHQGEALAAAKLQEARQSLKGLNHAPESLDRFDGLETLLHKLAEVEARHAEATERVDGAAASLAAASPTEGVPDAPCVEGIALLANWLHAGSDHAAAKWLPVVLGSLGAALGLLQLSGSLASPVAWLVAGLLIGLSAWLWLRDRGAGRALLETEFAGRFPGAPQEWQPAAVAERLAKLQADVSRQEVRRRAAEELQRAERRQQRLADQRAGLSSELADLRGEVGLAPEGSRLRFHEVADQLKRQVAASHEFAEATALKETVRVRRVNELATVNEGLALYGVKPVDNAEDLRAASENLRNRESSRQNASDQLAAAKRRIAAAELQLAESQTARDEFLADLQLGDAGELELLHRLERLADWQAANEHHGELERDVRNLERHLEKHPDLLAFDAALATKALEENRALAESYQPLTDEIAALDNKIESAQRGHDITDALDEESRRREVLSDLRDELLEGVAADLLLEGVASDHQQTSQPDILRDAGVLFGQFTRNRYELLAATYSTSGLPFEIRETDGVTKQLNELSSGTRSQLGLALRFAVAKSVELDEPLPLILDEALTNSDPERFRDVVRSLNQMVELGRQILFLTSDPADAARLEDVLKELDAEPARTFDLDQMRGETRAAKELKTEPLPSIPAPKDGESGDAYAKRLRVPCIDVFAGVNALHAYYLASDDLPALHRLLRERVETVGKALHLLASQKGIWSEDQQAKLRARRDVAAAWLDHFQVGRAPRLQPEVLRDGPLAKSTYIDSLIEMNEELGGNARLLIEAIDVKAKDRDPRLKRFVKSKRDELRDDLEARGLFTEDEVLSPEDRKERCLAAGKVHLEQGTLTREVLLQLSNAFEQWVGPSLMSD